MSSCSGLFHCLAIRYKFKIVVESSPACGTFWVDLFGRMFCLGMLNAVLKWFPITNMAGLGRGVIDKYNFIMV